MRKLLLAAIICTLGAFTTCYASDLMNIWNGITAGGAAGNVRKWDGKSFNNLSAGHLRTWNSFKCVSSTTVAACTSASTTNGNSFIESFGDSSSLCWTAGPSTCGQIWALTAGSPTIVASPGSPSANTVCANSLYLNGAQTVTTYGAIPYIAAGTTFDLYTYIYVTAGSAFSYTTAISPMDEAGSTYPGRILFNYTGGNLVALAQGSTASGNTAAISLNAWHVLRLHIDATAANSYIKLDAGSNVTFTANSSDINQVQFNGVASATWYVGDSYITSAVGGGPPPNLFVDFAGNTSGVVVTAGNIATGTHCGNDPPAVITGSTIAYSNAQSITMNTAKTACGTSYPGNAGLSVKHDLRTTDAIQHNFLSMSNTASIGGFLYFNISATDTTAYNVFAIRQQGGGAASVHEEGSGTTLRVFLETPNGGSNELSSSYNISPNTWYWITMLYTVGGPQYLKIYETSTWTLLATLSNADSAATAPANAAVYGHSGSNLSTPAQYIYYDNIVVDYVNGTFPILP